MIEVKPRQYGISGETAFLLNENFNIDNCKDYVAQYGRYGDPEPIHVIEYYAYDNMKADNDKLQQDLASAKELIGKLKKSFQFYGNKNFDRVCFMDHSTTSEEYGADARKQLEQIEKWESGK